MCERFSRSTLGIAPQIVIDEVKASGFEMLQLRTDWPGRGPLESYCALFRKPAQGGVERPTEAAKVYGFE